MAQIVAVGGVATRPSIANFKFKDIEVTLNVGKIVGLLPGVELRATSNKACNSVTISLLEEDQAFGVITQIGGGLSDAGSGLEILDQAPTANSVGFTVYDGNFNSSCSGFSSRPGVNPPASSRTCG